MDLDYKRSQDRVTLRKVLKIVDPNNTQSATKENVIAFFALPNFLDV
jgi:hypothetical protein